MYSNIT
jgi:hypothetical protein